jgi:hypothetical protein
MYGPERGIIGIGARILIIGLIAAWIIFERHFCRKDIDSENKIGCLPENRFSNKRRAI